jgi:hypothetical protein
VSAIELHDGQDNNFVFNDLINHSKRETVGQASSGVLRHAGPCMGVFENSLSRIGATYRKASLKQVR